LGSAFRIERRVEMDPSGVVARPDDGTGYPHRVRKLQPDACASRNCREQSHFNAAWRYVHDTTELGDLADRNQRNTKHRCVASVASPFHRIEIDRQI
jgi:hypothetical protein